MLNADRLKALRKNSGLLQKDLASQMGIDRTSYGKYENAGIQPPPDMVVKLADYFGVSTDYLLGKSDTPNPQELIIPDILKNVPVAFHRGEFEDLNQDEVDALARIATELKILRKAQ